jgi:hypothetical protein
MRIHDEGGTTAADAAQFCAACGTGLADGRFCPGCGQPTGSENGPFPRFEAAGDAAATYAKGGAPLPATARQSLLTDIEETARLSAQSVAAGGGFPARPSKPRSRWPVFAAGGLLIVAIGVLAVILLTGGSSSGSESGSASYARQAAAAFQPLNSANQQLSTALAGLHGRSTAGARAAVTQAQSATSAARGALAALPAPDASDQLPIQLRQAFDREDAYLAAVSTALAHPSDPGVAQLPSLAGNLTSSLDAVGAPLAGAAQSVTGAEALAAWARGQKRARAAAARRAAARRRANAANVAAGGSTPATGLPSVTPTPTVGPSDCGGGLHVNPVTTTCPFARNVQQMYREASGSTASVEAASPVTGKLYTMYCRPEGGGIACSGGNNASLSW